MNIKVMIQELLDTGMSQRALAEAVGVRQPTIHRSLHGAEIRYSVGKKVEKLHKKLIRRKRDNKTKKPITAATVTRPNSSVTSL